MRYLLAAALAFLGAPAFAATAPNYAGSPMADVAQILNSIGTAAVTLTTAGTSGSRRFSLACTNTDTIAYTLAVSRVRAATSYLLATVTIPASAGNVAATPRVQVLSAATFPGVPLDPNGNPFLTLQSGDTLTIAVSSAVTSGKVVACESSGVDF